MGDLNLSIDSDNLAAEWRDQAGMMYDWGKAQAGAQLAYDQMRSRAEVVDAELALEIRKDPEDFGITKITESVVAATILVQPEHADAQAAVASARHDLDVVKAATNALEHRKRALDGMTSLFNRAWTSNPSNQDQPQELKKAEEERNKDGRRGRARKHREATDDAE